MNDSTININVMPGAQINGYVKEQNNYFGNVQIIGSSEVKANTIVDAEEDAEEDDEKPTGKPENTQEQLNLFAPKINLQKLLSQSWFAEVRTDAKYDAHWTDAFIEALMASEYGEEIARQWAVNGERNKRTQLKGYIVGLLKDAGVLKGSYDSIAAEIGISEEPRTFSRYMAGGKKQPYAGWVKGYVEREQEEH